MFGSKMSQNSHQRLNILIVFKISESIHPNSIMHSSMVLISYETKLDFQFNLRVLQTMYENAFAIIVQKYSFIGFELLLLFLILFIERFFQGLVKEFF